MKNLENYNVQKMNNSEVKNINGGWLWVPGLIGDAIATYYELKNTATSLINNN